MELFDEKSDEEYDDADNDADYFPKKDLVSSNTNADIPMLEESIENDYDEFEIFTRSNVINIKKSKKVKVINAKTSSRDKGWKTG